MPSCVAFNCKKRTAEKGAKVSLFRFPHHDKARMLSWVHNINRKNWMPSPDSRLCALHFTKECFHPSCGKSLLNSNAVPTIFAYPGVNTSFKKPAVSNTSFRTQAASTLTEVSDTVNFDHTYCCKPVNSTSAIGQVAPSTEVTNVVEPTICSTTVTTNQNSVSVPEVSDGHESTAPLENVTLEQMAVGNILSETAKSPNAQITIRKLQMKIHKMGRKLVISRKRLKIEKQKTRRLNSRISSFSAVIQELNQKLGQMKEEAMVMAKSNSKANPKSKPKSKPKSDLQSDPLSKPKGNPKSKPKSDPQSKPRSNPKSKPKSDPKSKPKSKVTGSNLN
ncbi:THAP domain-containing protein 1-like [Eleginops maclovinus]|uniref:THAP domain-containing protein 1-like n=1 Tax=Eleginops maclovinus TaxID=56733 RepID=UPI003080F23D